MTAARSDLMALADKINLSFLLTRNAGSTVQEHLSAAEFDMVLSALRLAASQPDREANTWIIIRDPGCVPDRKGPFKPGQTASFLREVFEARPLSFVEVVTLHDGGAISVQDGPECLEMTDGRSAPTARKHRERLSLLSGAGTKSDGGCMADFSPDDPKNLKELLSTPSVLERPSDTPIADSSEARRGELTLAQISVASDMFAAWCGDPQYRQAFRDDCKRLVALSAPVGEPSREAVASMLARMLYNDATLDNCTESERESWLTAADAIRTMYRPRPPAPAVGAVKAGGVQGSTARKRSSDPEGSSRTETAGGDA